ncbi:chemotaxis protein CheD [Altererythrobacter buctensis]|uniref:Probable chemoreceptor glutamine deamidase CheD n=2 Tax=Alteraurantiacibacter buctensis TaxID=1503981 RepID=A0A844YW15_9SPHN|nr:chemotaxis protein CheD [Alteraurantiacibacter buctensis]
MTPFETRSSPVKRIAVIQGEVRTSADPDVELTTVLGSCVATCLYDPVARIGGMNHFLLAEPPEHQRSSGDFDEHYGLYLMELLINRMIGCGAVKGRMKARLFGGANFYHTIQQIGAINAEFARRFLQQEGIGLVNADLGGTCARRVHFRPASGQVRCKNTEAKAIAAPQPTRRPPTALGEVELF